MMKRYDFEDGKYIVKRDGSTFKVEIYRNGERWSVMEDEMKYCKFFHSMLNKIDGLEGRIHD